MSRFDYTESISHYSDQQPESLKQEGSTVLFDDFQRTNGNPSEYREPLYTFLNRAAGGCWQSVRDNLTEWLSDYPVDEQPTLIARFRRTDRRGFLGAFWELYLHELFRRLGFQIELHPEVAGTTHRPDFRLLQGSTVVYVEAVTIYEPQAHSIDDARLAPVLDAISRISSSRFLVTVDARQIASTALPLERLSREIESWLGTLESESVSSSARTPDRMFRWQEGGWMLIFRPIPRSATATGTTSGPGVGIGPVRTRRDDDHRAIRNRLSGRHDQPLADLDQYQRADCAQRFRTADSRQGNADGLACLRGPARVRDRTASHRLRRLSPARHRIGLVVSSPHHGRHPHSLSLH